MVSQIHREGESDSTRHLSVSAISRSAVGSFPVLGSKTYPGDICIVAVPHAPNRNLLAQFGALTITPVNEDELESPTDRRPIDELLLAGKDRFLVRVEKYSKQRGERSRPPLMVHFKLPWNEAPKLLWLLLKEHVSYHQMFPNYEGVVRSLDETVRLLQLRDRGVW